MSNIIWKTITEYESLYEVSSLGDIKSLRSGKILKKSKQTAGYLKVNLSYNGIVKRPLVHRVVAKYFIDNPDNKKTVNHKDGNKLNNNINNLEWSTYSENISHAYKNKLNTPHGQKGSTHGRSKLNESDIFNIRSLLNKGLTHTYIASLFNVSIRTIGLIKSRKTWSHI